MERVKLLVERGADLKKLSKNRFTARDWAQLSKKQQTKEYLEGIMAAKGILFEDVVINNDEEED